MGNAATTRSHKTSIGSDHETETMGNAVLRSIEQAVEPQSSSDHQIMGNAVLRSTKPETESVNVNDPDKDKDKLTRTTNESTYGIKITGAYGPFSCCINNTFTATGSAYNGHMLYRSVDEPYQWLRVRVFRMGAGRCGCVSN